jgi:hypothetical protein
MVARQHSATTLPAPLNVLEGKIVGRYMSGIAVRNSFVFSTRSRPKSLGKIVLDEPPITTQRSRLARPAFGIRGSFCISLGPRHPDKLARRRLKRGVFRSITDLMPSSGASLPRPTAIPSLSLARQSRQSHRDSQTWVLKVRFDPLVMHCYPGDLFRISFQSQNQPITRTYIVLSPFICPKLLTEVPANGFVALDVN